MKRLFSLCPAEAVASDKPERFVPTKLSSVCAGIELSEHCLASRCCPVHRCELQVKYADSVRQR